jgi:hypothetical protein
MDFLIVFKWLKFWDPEDKLHPPPSIISTMMDIGLKVGSTVILASFRKNPSQCGEMQVILRKTQYR